MEPRPVINVGEFIGKTVGRRRAPGGAGMQILLNQALKSQGRGFPRGVKRFRTHEEANEWNLKQMTSKKAAS